MFAGLEAEHRDAGILGGVSEPASLRLDRRPLILEEDRGVEGAESSDTVEGGGDDGAGGAGGRVWLIS